MHRPPTTSITLPDEVVVAICALLGTVEDWLLHAGDDVVADLGEFLGRNPDRVIRDLGATTVMLRRWDRT